VLKTQICVARPQCVKIPEAICDAMIRLFMKSIIPEYCSRVTKYVV